MLYTWDALAAQALHVQENEVDMIELTLLATVGTEPWKRGRVSRGVRFCLTSVLSWACWCRLLALCQPFTCASPVQLPLDGSFLQLAIAAVLHGGWSAHAFSWCFLIAMLAMVPPW